MPIPILVAAGIAAVGGLGVAGTLAAKDTMDEAKALGERGERLIAAAKERAAAAQSATQGKVEELGNTKIRILSNNMNTFLRLFRTMKDVKFNDSVGMDELRDFTPQSNQVRMLTNASVTAADLTRGYGGGIASGGVVALGAYGAVGMLGTASTGTAIGTLSGAAATNATLAWLGGGSLAAGGLGVAGGAAVLGGIVAAPALLAGAFYLNCKADEAMSKAKTFYAQAETYQAQCNYSCKLLSAISERAGQITYVLNRMDGTFGQGVRHMHGIIARSGTDWNALTRAQQEHVAAVAMMAKTMKVIMDTPLCREDGSLNPESARVLQRLGTG